MHWQPKHLVPLLALGTLALGLRAAVEPARARAAAPRPAASLAQAVAQGKAIFDRNEFGGVRTCSSCHLNGGTTLGRLPNGAKIPSLIGAAAEFPRFKASQHGVVTLEQQIAHCIRGGVQGTPPAPDSPQMTDLVTYLTSLSKGAVMGKQFK